MPRNFYDGFTYTTVQEGTDEEAQSQSATLSREYGISILDDPQVRQQLAQRLRNLQYDQDHQQERTMDHRNNRNDQMIEQYSIDKRFLMIHPQNLKKLTPNIRAP